MTPLVPVDTGDILARSRPRAILALWMWEAALGLVIGSSVASVASGAYGHHPDGDAPLFLPGGLPLLDLARHSLVYGPLVSLVVVIAVVAHLAGIVPSAAAFAGLASVARRPHAPGPRHARPRDDGRCRRPSASAS